MINKDTKKLQQSQPSNLNEIKGLSSSYTIKATIIWRGNGKNTSWLQNESGTILYHHSND